MKRKIVGMLLCMTMAAGLLTGCSGGNDSKGSSDKQESADGGKESVVIWDYFETDAQKNMMQELWRWTSTPISAQG